MCVCVCVCVCVFIVVIVDEGREDQSTNTTNSGPSLARHRNAIEMVFGWRADNVPILNAGLIAL